MKIIKNGLEVKQVVAGYSTLGQKVQSSNAMRMFVFKMLFLSTLDE